MKSHFIIMLICLPLIGSCQSTGNTEATAPGTKAISRYNELTEQEKKVILNKATDHPFTGEYTDKFDNGLYICRQCNNPLYHSEDKFHSQCGWPSFDDEIEGAVKRVPDPDGFRVEIVCQNCKGHLGHVFEGEGFTDKDTRHCVNTSSLRFVPKSELDSLPAVIK